MTCTGTIIHLNHSQGCNAIEFRHYATGTLDLRGLSGVAS